MKKQLIRLIKQHDVLYNTKNPKYTDAGARNAAWDKVAVYMNNMSVEDCKTEWNRLRNCYANAYNRRRGKTYLPPWRYEREMGFIKPYMRKVRGRRPSSEQENSMEREYSMERENSGGRENSRGRVTQDSDTDVSIEIPQLDDYVIEQKVERLNYDPTDKYNIIPGNDVMKKISSMDETDLFFLGLSRTLKKLSQIEQCRLKMELFTIVNEAEMKFLMQDKSSVDCEGMNE